MKTKVRLNCYFFSNLIVGLLTLSCLFNEDKTLVQIKKDGGRLEPIYAIADEVINEPKKEEVKEDVKGVDIEPKVTTISVTKKTLASKKVINYIKPSYNSVTGTNLVNYAKHYLGLPYISAGRSLETGTDCSGFTRLIFREFGINQGATVSSQLYSGSYVSKSDLQPGDLVFYGYSTRATHVAIYIGGGQIIHESNPRDGVKISSVNIMVYITSRRLITKNVVKEDSKDKTEITKSEETKTEEIKKEEVKDNSQTTNQKDVVTNNKKVENTTPKVEIEDKTMENVPKVETPKKEEAKVEEKKEEKKTEETPKIPDIKVEDVKPELPNEEKKEEIKEEQPKLEETPKNEETKVVEKKEEAKVEVAPKIPEVTTQTPSMTPENTTPNLNSENKIEDTSISNIEENKETSK